MHQNRLTHFLFCSYVNESTALRLGLTSFTHDSFVIRADYTTNLTSSDPGRNSVRIMSKNQWDTHVEIMDVRHMPQGCGTWPAYW